MRLQGSSCSGSLEPIRWPEMISLLEIRELDQRFAARRQLVIRSRLDEGVASKSGWQGEENPNEAEY